MLSPVRSRFVLFILTVLVAFAAYPEPCGPSIPPPVINAPTQVCPYAPATATIEPPAEGSWAQMASWGLNGGYFVDENGSILQSPPLGTTARFMSNNTGPVTLTFWGEHSSGCQGQASREVAIRTIPAPVINAPAEVCPYMPAVATMAPPAEGSWQMASWGITNGSFVDENGYILQYPPTGTTARFISNNTGPVTLSAYSADNFGCQAPIGTATVNIRTIPQVQIIAPAEVCPYSPAEASMVPPAEGSWQMASWGISGGSFVDENGNLLPYGPIGTTARFISTNTGPVTLTAWAADNFGCQAPNGSATVNIRTIGPASINAPTQVCTYTPADASIAPPAEGAWQYVSWSIQNGSFVDANGNPITYVIGENIRFQSDNTGPVTLTVSAADTFGCMTNGSITIPTVQGGGGPAPSITLSSSDICGYETITASVAPTYSSYAWTVVNGDITSGAGTSSITFAANGVGPVTVSVITDGATCGGTDSETLPLRATPVPIYAPASACVGSLQKVTVPYWYTSIAWTVLNATIEPGSGGDTIYFRSTGAGPVHISVQATDYMGCFAPNSVSIPLGDYPTPEIWVSSPTMCPGGGSGAQTAGDLWTNYQWSVTNGTITSGQGTSGIQFTHTEGAGDPVVSVSVGEGACTASASRTITVRTTTDLIVELATPTVCPNGNGVFYIDNYDSYSYVAAYLTNGHVTGISAGRAPGGRTVTFRNNGAGNTVIQISADSNSCLETASMTATMAAPATATITAGGPTTFCAGGSVTLTANPGASYLWSNGATTQSINATAAGAYTVQVTSATGCSATSAATTVTVNANPTVDINVTQVLEAPGSGAIVSNANDVVEVCGDPTIRLVPTVLDPANTYSWSNGATTAVLDIQASGTYTLTMTDANGCVATSSVTVNYTAYPAKPVITAPSTELCPAGGSITLSAPVASSWLWSNGATTQSIVVTAPGSYTVRVKNGLCESPLSDPVIITTGSSTISVTGTTDLCANGSVTLTANAGSSWLWSNGATTQSIVVTSAGSYSVTTSNNGCAMEPSAAVVVTQRSMSVTADGPTTFCPGEDVTLTASLADSYLWSNGATTRSITVFESGNYSVTGSFADGCSILSSAVSVEKRVSTATINADRTSVCPGGAIQLNSSVSGSSGYSYQWFDNSYTAISGATSAQLSYAPTSSGFVYLKVTDSLGCVTTSNSISFTVEPTPNATITAPASICEGATGAVSVADAGPNATYNWSITNGTINPSGHTATFSPSGTSAVQISVTVTNPGCSATSSATVTVNPLPDATISPAGSPAICPGDSVTLSAPAGYASYLWSNGQTGPSINVSYANAGNYTVTVTTASGCSRQSAVKTVTQNPATNIHTQPLSQPMPFKSTRTLSVGATGTGTLLYQWYEGNVGDTSKPKGNQETQQIGPFQKKGTYRFWVKVWSASCPTSSVNSTAAVITAN